MFTSNGLNPYPQYYYPSSSSSSSYNPINPPILNQDVSHDHHQDIFFHHQNHHYQDHPLSSPPPPFLLHNSTEIPEATTLMNLQGSFSNATVSAMKSKDHNNVLKPTKKDRHSKICTAHGLRDRRVRLSIEIAREFFDLQDMLGFDKASKTVEWLLNKSKSSIKELELLTQSGNAGFSNSGNSEGEVIVGWDINEMEIDNGGDFGGILELSRNKSLIGEDDLNAIAKDSRAKARARARERTKDKILSTTTTTTTTTKRTCEQDFSNLSPNMLNQFRAMNQYQLQDHDNQRSSFCSITDINLSTELQMNGRN